MTTVKLPNYKGLITWDVPYTKTFEQFQKDFEKVWVFTEMEEKVRLKELKKAFAIATNKEPEAKKPTEK